MPKHLSKNHGLAQAKTYPASQFGIDKSLISHGALTVMSQLHKANYQAYLVGGAIRDMILGLAPKDFDIATNATPEQVQAIFRRARIIGRRFRIVHVYQGKEIIEVTTFRGHHEKQHKANSNDDGILLRDNVFGSIEEDAYRRDFSINALYYDSQSHCIYDFTDAVQAIENKTIAIIGDAVTRYTEDPVRMLRAVRFASKLGFQLQTDTLSAIGECAPLLAQVPSARRFDCALKLFCKGYGEKTFAALKQYQLLPYLFHHAASLEHDRKALALIEKALHNSDARVQQGRPITASFIFTAILWPALTQQLGQTQLKNLQQEDIHAASYQVLRRQLPFLHLSKHIQAQIQAIWNLQLSLERYYQQEPRARRVIEQPAFRAAYDFLLIRAEVGLADAAVANWWKLFVQNTPEAQSKHPIKKPHKRPASSA